MIEFSLHLLHGLVLDVSVNFDDLILARMIFIGFQTSGEYDEHSCSSTKSREISRRVADGGEAAARKRQGVSRHDGR